MQPSTLLLSLLTPLLTLAAPFPFDKKLGRHSGVDITVYRDANCTGISHERLDFKYGANAQDSPPAKSYRLSKNLVTDDYLTFGAVQPEVAHGDKAKKGCHNLKHDSYVFTFHKRMIEMAPLRGNGE